MERFKIEDYEREHGERTFPAFRSLTEEEADHILTLLRRSLGLPLDLSAEGILQTIDQRSITVTEVDARLDDFDLKAVLERLGFFAEKVLLNWYRFDRIDEFRTDDLCNLFIDVFYPSADDIEIMDSGLTWLLSIRHYGAVKALGLK